MGLALSWELDLWGRLRRLSESARAQYLATEEGRRGVVVSLIGDVMNDYFLLRERDLELDIARRTRDIAQDNLRLVELRHTRGAATGLDVHQAEQFLYTATAQIASAQHDHEQTEMRLRASARSFIRRKGRRSGTAAFSGAGSPRATRSCPAAP